MNLGFLFVLFLVLSITFCDENKLAKYANAKKLSVGIKKRIPTEECTQRVEPNNRISVHYTGMLASTGAKFDSSLDRGEPFTFTVGVGQVIKGWDLGLNGACVGEKRRIVIPSELGYGKRGAPPSIPADSVLVFDVEIVSIDA